MICTGRIRRRWNCSTICYAIPPRHARCCCSPIAGGAAPDSLLAALRAGCERIELAALSRADAGPLLERVPDAGAREQIYLESGGNPFYLEQLAQAAARRKSGPHGGAGGARRDDGLDADPEGAAIVPRVVSDALTRELDALPEEARLVLRAAALAGELFGPELVAGIAQLATERALARLDLALDAGLICESDSPLWFRFRHPIVRRVVYASAGAAWRIGAHARAAALLAAQGASITIRAHHVQRSAPPGDLGAVDLLAQAGHASLALAPASAAVWFTAALRLLPHDCGPERRLALLGPQAAALGAAGRLHQARAALAEVHALLAFAHPAARGRVVGFIAVIDRLLGQPGDARELLSRSLRELPGPQFARGRRASARGRRRPFLRRRLGGDARRGRTLLAGG